MRHKVTLQAPAFTRDPATNQKLQSWTTVGTLWGLMKPLHGREAVNAKQIKAEVTSKFTTRWQGATTIDPSMQLLFAGDTYKIGEVLDVDSRNKELHILCTKVVVPA
jgi:SPP1 family predicted phage head-tail adaptor